MRRLNIRWQLTLWFGMAMTTLLVIRSLWIYKMMEDRLVTRADLELNIALDELSLLIQSAPNRAALQEIVESHAGNLREWDIRVLGKDDDLLFESPTIVSDETEKLIHHLNYANRQYTTLDAGQWRRRFVTEQLSTPLGPVTLRVGRSIQAEQNETWDFVVILLQTLPLVFVTAIGVGYFISSRALKPVTAMVASAKEITAKRLDQRIPVPESDDELARLAQTFNEMMDRLYHAFEEMRRFTADAAHDLRTPVTALRTELEVGLLTNETVEEYRESMEILLAEAIHLSRLTDQLLDLCREEHGIHADQNEPVSLTLIVQEVVEDLQMAAQQKKIDVQVDLDESFVVIGDPLRIRRVFTNLISNAVQYTNLECHVRVSGRQVDHHFVVDVVDDGPGIPANDLPHIFERFHRVDKSRNREMGGTGLGLSICKAIVEAHGGKIAIKSAVGKGTCVSVSFPSTESTRESADLEWRIA